MALAGPGGNQRSKRWHYVDETVVFVDGSGDGTPKHLNSTLPPDDVNAATEFTYLVTDGSDDGPYLKADT